MGNNAKFVLGWLGGHGFKVKVAIKDDIILKVKYTK